MIVVVRDLSASRVNLLMNDFAAGLPSPLAFLGLGAAIAPALRVGRWDVGVLPVLHRVDASDGRTKAEYWRDAGVFTPKEIPEDLTGSVRASLLLDVPGDADEHDVEKTLIGRRIAGGVIHNTDIEPKAATPDGSAFRGLSRGYAMVRPAFDKCRIVSTGAIETLKALAAELYPEERQPGAGWHVPVAVGHRLLEDPATAPRRQNTRDPEIPHVFTEPVVGVAELISVRNKRLTELDESGLRALFWRWTAEERWIVGHPDYHPKRHAQDS